MSGKSFGLFIIPILLIIFTHHASSDEITTPYNTSNNIEKAANAPETKTPDTALIRNTNAGTVIGFFDAHDTLAWLGIPYAKPPVGDLRWRAPQAPAPWDTPLDASEYASPCTQFCSILSMDEDKLGKPYGDEDCLYLNIWRPNSDETLPVYFWIHGGGNSIGQTMDFNGSYFAEKANVIYVCPAYRLGPFGWFKHPSLDSRTSDDTPLDNSGNFGTLDLIKALEWVRDNIAQFGGDPDNVTVGGQSAGGTNIFSLLLSPGIKYNANSEEKYLFHKAISQSGQLKIYSHADAEKSAHDVLSRLLINDHIVPDQKRADSFINDTKNSAYISDYLLTKSAYDILEYGYGTSTSGMLNFPRLFDDGNVIVSNAEHEFNKGNYYQVPMIIGDTADEAKLNLAIMMTKLTGKELINAIINFDPNNPGIQLRDLVANPKLYNMVASVTNKVLHQAYVNKPVRILSQYNNTYVYQFSWDNEPEPFNDFLGACHAIELPFLTGSYMSETHYLKIAWSNSNKDEVIALSEAMIAYWSNFIWTGDPNDKDLVLWEPWTNSFQSRQRLILDKNIHSWTKEL